MLEAWGHIIYRWRRATLVLSALLLAASVAILLRGGILTVPTVGGTESDVGVQTIANELHQPAGSQLTIVLQHARWEGDSEEFRAEAGRLIERLRRDRRVTSVRNPYEMPMLLAAMYVSADRHRVVVQATLRDGMRLAAAYYPAIRAGLQSNRLEVLVTGPLPFKQDLDEVLERDLQRGEVVSIPLALIVLLLVFGSLVAALLPVGVGGLAVAGGMAGVMLLSRVTDVTQYCLNVVSLIGTGVAIDYSLFMVNRFREEIGDGSEIERAISRTLATAGRAVMFSGLAVAIGLSGLLFYRGTYLSALGVAGAIVVALAVIYALTFLPALLAVLGTRVNAGRVALPKITPGEGFWHGMATWVMRRPVLVLLPTLAFTLVLGLPFLRLRLVTADINVLPAESESRRAHTILRDHFPMIAANRVIVLARFPGTPMSPDRVSAMFAYSRRLAALRGVTRVESPVDLDASMDLEGYQQMFALPGDQRPPGLDAALHELVGRRVALFSVVTEYDNSSAGARDLVDRIRTMRRVGDGDVIVTGMTAIDLDNMRFIVRHSPAAVAFVMIATIIILFLLLGSVLLPIKAVVMNLLSITASFGSLVWIFQDGHFSRALGFVPGPIEPTLPVVLFCAVFGLSMDYEVLMLSRMQEEYTRTGDNTKAVAEGLERTGRLITSAAAIMVAVFVAFALAKVVLLKAMGLGMAIAVALDATIVRILIVPATMRLFGDLNWWAPRPLARLYDKIGFKRLPH